jgi:hypothetical protein
VRIPRIVRSAAAAAAAAASLSLAAGCNAEEARPQPSGDRDDSAGEDCPAFGGPGKVGRLETGSAKEISGLAVSRLNDGVLWAVNDGGPGDRDILIAFDQTGRHIIDWELDGVDNVNWEDLAIGAGPEPGIDYLYVADTGDEELERGEVRVYRVPEPLVDAADEGARGEIPESEIERFELEYDDGEPHDAEALILDPVTGDLYVVTKANDDDRDTAVYRARPPFHPTQDNLLEKVLDEDDAADLDGTVVGGSVTEQGDRIILLFREGHVRTWARDPADALWKTLATDGCKGPSATGHQESVAFGADGLSYFLVPEGEDPPIWLVQPTPQ